MAQNTIQSPCPIALILSEGTNSSEQNSSTHYMYNLDPLHFSLCNGSNSLRGDKQHTVTVRTALSQTAPNNIELLSSRQRWWASQWITLLVNGAAYSIGLIRDFVLLTLELAMVGLVVVWIDARLGRALVLCDKIRRMSVLIRCWSMVAKLNENLNRALLQQCLLPSVAQPDLRSSCSVPPPLGALAPQVGPLLPPSWRHNTRRDRLYECPPAWKQ